MTISRIARLLQAVGLCVLLAIAGPARAASSAFDLIGPRLDVAVTRDGITLPLEGVPNLSEGDRVTIAMSVPEGKGERYRLVAAFLNGAVDRPSDKWFHEARSWKPKSATLSLIVPPGAKQMALFITPESGGGADAIASAVRKQPGAFVRAVQELNQASLDRARLDAFLRAMQKAESQDADSVATVSPILTRSLAIKLKAECLQQPAQVQAACLTGDRDTLLLADSHSSALADTLTGTPTDLAFQLSATPQAGYGAYSSYIGVVRDLFRLFGAFQSTQLQFIPALSQMAEGKVTLLLNTPISFAKPASVIVLGMPMIEAPKPPPLRNSAPGDALCARPGIVLPVEGAPLVYATGYAHDMAIRFEQADGTGTELPVRADPSVGGFVLDGTLPAGADGPGLTGRLHGNWGFGPFDGPSFTLSRPGAGPWTAAERSGLIVGRANDLLLQGDAPGCVTGVAMRRGDGPALPLAWKQSGANGIVATVPLEAADPGPVSILVETVGQSAPAVVPLRALEERGSIQDLVLHAGDADAVLTGTRLDQVRGVTIGTIAFQPGLLTRVGKQDQLALEAADPAKAQALAAGAAVAADVLFTDGRHSQLTAAIAPRRAAAALLRVSARSPPRPGLVPILLSPADVFAQEARIDFAFRGEAPATLSGRETIEIATTDGRAAATVQAGQGYDLQDATTGIVSFDPVAALGPVAYGPLRFRVLRDGEASGWTPLATIVRLPQIRTIACVRGKSCRLGGERLFLIKAIGTTPDFRAPQEVPDGFVAAEIVTGPMAEDRLFLRLRDAPQVVATVAPRAGN